MRGNIRHHVHSALRGAQHHRVAAVLTSLCLPLPGAVSAAFPPEIALASLEPANGGDGTMGVVLLAATPGDLIGSSVASAGDMNGDGLADVLIGAPGESRCANCAGYLVFGRQHFAAGLHLIAAALSSGGSDAVVIRGADPGDRSGRSVSAVGDVNGDALPDFIVGASYADGNGIDRSGRAYVVFGRPAGFPAIFNLASLLEASGGDGSHGFAINGWLSLDRVGWSASGGCDIDADGRDDVIVGGPNDPPGRAYAIFGRDTGFPAEIGLDELLPDNGGDGSEGVVFNGVAEEIVTGWAVRCAGDTNGDAVDDLLISSPGHFYFVAGPGDTYLVHGRPDGFPPVFELSRLLEANGGDGSEGSVIQAADLDDYSGESVGAGDVNGDGLDDVLIGAPYGDVGGEYSIGRAYVLFGREGGLGAEPALLSLHPENGGDGSRGFVMTGTCCSTGKSVGVAGDVDGDAIDDILVGSPRRAGNTFVVFGRAGPTPPEVQLADLFAANGGDGTEGVVLIGAGDTGSSGEAVSGAGDVNGDGVADILVGAPHAELGGFENIGKAYIVFGRAGAEPQR